MTSSNELTTAAFKDILSIIDSGREQIARKANTILLDTYWKVGEFISAKVANDGWGKGVVKELSNWLAKNSSSKGFSASNLWRMRQFYELYSSEEKLAPLVRELSWTNHLILMAQCKSVEEHVFYGVSALKGNWSKRDLQQQIKSGSFERTVLADSKLAPAVRDLQQSVKGVFKDSYLIDFADLNEPHLEADLQSAIVHNLKEFLLELGAGFSFVGEKVRIQVGQTDFELDLLFYHRDLQCLVAFELKRGEFHPKDLGQLAFYLEALDQKEKRPHENPSIGVLLCRSKDDEVVKFALNSTASPALVAEYETKLVPKELLQKKLNEWYDLLEETEPDDSLSIALPEE